MTLEKASELVNALRELRDGKAEELFDHFVDFFSLHSQAQLEMFAELCGYGVLRNVELKDQG